MGSGRSRLKTLAMYSLFHHYQNESELIDFLSDERLASPQVLLQVFSGGQGTGLLQQIIDRVHQTHPSIKTIGSSTSGEIIQKKVTDGQIILCFSVFTETQLEIFYIPQLSQQRGQQLGEQAKQLNAKGIILFADTLQGQPQHLLDGITQTAPDLVIAGGSAGDNDCFEQATLVYQNQCFHQGAVGVFLINPNLIMHTDSVLNWSPIGPLMTITRCNNEVVYELNNRPVLEVYQHYLGQEVINSLPQSIIEFPLIIEQQGLQIGRSALSETDDGGLVFAGTFKEGDQVHFGVADFNTILQQSGQKAQQTAADYPVESIFIYSCTARRAFLRQHIQAELSALSALAPAAGFFTYGEYFHYQQQNALLNISTTFLTLSESTDHHVKARPTTARCLQQASTVRSLTHLANITTQELNSSIQFLEQYKTALDQSAIVSKSDKYGNITYINSAFEQISGYTEQEVMGKNHNVLRHPDMPEAVFSELWQTLKKKEVWRGTIKNRKKDGSAYYVKSVILPILDSQGELLEYISIRDDVTELLQKERELQQERLDILTGLPNRRQLLLDLDQHQACYLALLDILNFKSFNDFYGFDFADQILQSFANWLKPFCEENALILYRIQGDRFALLPMKTFSVEAFNQTLLKIKNTVHQHQFVIDYAPIELDVRYGIGQGERYQLQLAETALNRAKRTMRSDDIPIEKEGISGTLDHLFWLHKLRDALAEGRIVNYYQPIVSNSGQPQQNKYEALVRMIGRDGEIISPFHFLDAAKKSRYYAQITQVVYLNALNMANQLDANISVNLSIEDIENDQTRQLLLEKLCGLERGAITFEITESESIQDYSVIYDFIVSAKALGAEIAIDDFGSGYSNFTYLVEMDADYLKIDGSIISKILEDRNSLLVAESIINIAKKLKIKVVAEYVSNQELADKLAEYGVEFYQGYLLGEPQPIDQLIPTHSTSSQLI